jgi:hypothetical protein
MLLVENMILQSLYSYVRAAQSYQFVCIGQRQSPNYSRTVLQTSQRRYVSDDVFVFCSYIAAVRMICIDTVLVATVGQYIRLRVGYVVVGSRQMTNDKSQYYA